MNSGDDAAGLAIANGYRSDQAVLTQGIQNANDGLSQLQIADGGISNISQLLDRGRTLATESASGTFTGNRGVLDSEFQSVLGEINRQAQSIGLNQGGTFAKNLSVFIGGGQASNGVSATQERNRHVKPEIRRPWMPIAWALPACRRRERRVPTSAPAAPPAYRTFRNNSTNALSIANNTTGHFRFHGTGILEYVGRRHD